MEESKARTRRSSTGPARPVRRGNGERALASSHVIDLRATKSAASPPTAAPVAKSSASPKPPKSPKPKPRRKPLAAPNQSAVDVPEPASATPSQPAAAPLGPALSSATAGDSSLRPRRFWPAFWRFLLLLVILGALVTGGFYLYINYYRG